MQTKAFHTTLTYLIAAVWLVNGLFCKVLHLVPRHQQIVARILGDEYAGLLTQAIGVGEIGMAVWMVSAWQTRWNTYAQMLLVAVMNLLEFVLVPDLLLFGRINAILACAFILVIYFNTFVLRQKLTQPA